MLEFEMKYKGDRSYLQGADIFDAISSKLNSVFEVGWIKKLSFKSFARSQCALVLKERPSKEEHQIGNGIWLKPSGKEVRFWIVETDKPVLSRYLFDEDGLVSPSCIESNTITLAADNDYSAIESIVALTKKLNYFLTPEVKGKWVFGQIDMLKSMPDSFNEIQITRTSERKGMFSCNQIVIDKELVGEIRFIVGQP